MTETAMTYEELDESRILFGLEKRATRGEIRARHRMLVKRHHPDTAAGSDVEMIGRINEAYRILREYIDSYRYSFEEEEFYGQNPEERLRRQFGDDPIWGGGHGSRN